MNTNQSFRNTRRTRRTVPCLVVTSELKMMRESTMLCGAEWRRGGETRRVSGGAYECSQNPPQISENNITLEEQAPSRRVEQSAPVHSLPRLAYRSKKSSALSLPELRDTIPKLLKEAPGRCMYNQESLPRSEVIWTFTLRNECMGIEVLPSLSMEGARY